LEGSGIASTVTVDASSSLLAFFLFGLVAGSSSCAALVGGVLLSMAKQWNEVYIAETTLKRSQPHIMFQVGRLISFSSLGGVLGLVGQALTISTEVSAIITIIISLLMLILGLQMLEVSWAKSIRFTLPKSFGSFIANEQNFRGRSMHF
jgi:sulfite exporter TauE/SafE